ncbi:MAG: fused MFS/spermidine synthase [Rubripirellula sp.]|nr:fused MFS/spermidine synthase [Rubripirellula sp.]
MASLQAHVGLRGSLNNTLTRVQSRLRNSFGLLCCLSTLISAFLLFQVQPVVSKSILPWFGGGHSIWTTCLVFFQVALLVGYTYAHLLVRLFSPLKQAALHLGFVSCAFLFLPLSLAEGQELGGSSNPGFVITWLLIANVAVPYVLLAATSPLLQAWYSRVQPGKIPYRLYALSNVGSLVALLSYPFLVEPNLGVRDQLTIWSIGFVAFAVLCCLLGIAIASSGTSFQKNEPGSTSASHTSPTIGTMAKWVGLAGCGSASLLIMTNHISTDMAVMPLMWLLPLSLYLVTFIISFESPRWYGRRWWALACGCLMVAFLLHLSEVWTPWDDFLVAIGISTRAYYNNLMLYALIGVSAMFCFCQVCHGELYRSRPNSDHLTTFYLCIAGGGAVGGLLISVVCPVIFSAFHETKLLVAVGLAFSVYLIIRDGSENWKLPAVGLGVITNTLVMLALGIEYNDLTFGDDETIIRQRNFYGTLSVAKEYDSASRSTGSVFYHGNTLHGFQSDSPLMAMTPLTYYSEKTGVSLAFEALSERKAMRVGVVGLGVGTLAAFGRPGERFDFFEINPNVEELANTAFTYLRDSQADCDVTIGDARISMQGFPDRAFDFLVLDAFSGDAIPAHLLTLEAFEMYDRLMKADGVIAVHISNLTLNLAPVVAAVAARQNLEMRYVEKEDSGSLAGTGSIWILLSRDKTFLANESLNAHSTDFAEYATPHVLWTDDKNCLLSVFDH